MMSEAPDFVAFVTLAIANLPLFLGLAWAGFGNLGNLADSARSSLDIDMQRYLGDDRWRVIAGELSLAGYVGVCALALAVEWQALQGYLG